MKYLLEKLRVLLRHLGLIRAAAPLPPLELASGEELTTALIRSGHWNGQTPLKINLAGTRQPQRGFINIGTTALAGPVEVLADPAALTVAPASVAELHAGPTFCQFDLPEALGQLVRWQRWLKPAGRVVLNCPDAIEWAKVLCSESAWDSKLRAIDQLTRWGRHNIWFPERFSRTLQALGFEQPGFATALDLPSGLHTNLQIEATKHDLLSDDQALMAVDKILSECAASVAERDRALARYQDLQAPAQHSLPPPAPASGATPEISAPTTAAAAPLVTVAIICRPSSQLFDLHATIESLRLQSSTAFEVLAVLDPKWQVAGELTAALGTMQLRILQSHSDDIQLAVLMAAQAGSGEYFIPLFAGDKLGRLALESWTALLKSGDRWNLAYSHVQNSGRERSLVYQPDFVSGGESDLPFACLCRRRLLVNRDAAPSSRHWSQSAQDQIAAVLVPRPLYHRHT